MSAAPQPRPRVESPCVKLCTIDEASGLCTGCRRSLAEIARWGSMTPAERRRIMDALPLRRTASEGR